MSSKEGVIVNSSNSDELLSESFPSSQCDSFPCLHSLSHIWEELSSARELISLTVSISFSGDEGGGWQQAKPESTDIGYLGDSFGELGDLGDVGDCESGDFSAGNEVRNRVPKKQFCE